MDTPAPSVASAATAARRSIRLASGGWSSPSGAAPGQTRDTDDGCGERPGPGAESIRLRLADDHGGGPGRREVRLIFRVGDERQIARPGVFDGRDPRNVDRRVAFERAVESRRDVTESQGWSIGCTEDNIPVCRLLIWFCECSSRRDSAPRSASERELRRKPAGLGTNILVALGAALFTIISIQLKADGGTGDRVAAGRHRHRLPRRRLHPSAPAMECMA